MIRRWNTKFFLAILVISALPHRAAAFKMKAHVVVANEALDSIRGGGEQAWIDFAGLGSVSLENEEVVAAVQNYPEYFRAGAIGPDGFPDLVAGQVWVHVNKGREGCNEEGTPSEECVSSGNTFESRTFEQWRSIDYGMYLLQQARNYYPEKRVRAGWEVRWGMHIPKYEWVTDDVARQQALAFAYGYLCHIMADGFSHGWVNEWTRGSFDYFHGRPGALFGPLTEEIQHLALEGYLDAFLPIDRQSDLELAIPVPFLNELFSSEVQVNGRTIAPAGAFAGEHFVQLNRVRNFFHEMGDYENWGNALEAATESDGLGELAIESVDAVLEAHSTFHDVVTLGTGVGDPLADLAGIFRYRGQMMDTLLDKWVVLSECVAQNLVRATALAGEILETDACGAINFERDRRIAKLFNGELNEAAHLGAGESDYDFGAMGSNLKKQKAFATTSVGRILTFSPLDDLQSLRTLEDNLILCEPIVEFGSCNDACETMKDKCKPAFCATCPSNCDGWWNKAKCAALPPSNCDGWWNKAKCAALPVWAPGTCFGCNNGSAVDAACQLLVNAATGVCEFCGVNSVCATVHLTEELTELLPRLMSEVFDEVLRELKAGVQRALLRQFAGPYANDVVAAHDQFSERRGHTDPGWFMNLAFLREDLTHDPDHLNELFANALGLPGLLVDNSLGLAQAVAHTVRRTGESGAALVRLYIWAVSGEAYYDVWRGIVQVLYRIARDRNFDAVRDLEGDGYNWLDNFNFRESNRTYETRYMKFIALLDKLELLAGHRGPTLRALRSALALSPNSPLNLSEQVDPYAVRAVNNSIQLSKLGFLSGAGIDGLLARVESPVYRRTEIVGISFYRRVYLKGDSDICYRHPHIACDAIQSLDDPNGYAATDGDIRYYTSARIDPERSVSLWRSRDIVWPGAGDEIGYAAGCEYSLTNFTLARTAARVSGLYRRIFEFPEGCILLNVVTAN